MDEVQERVGRIWRCGASLKMTQVSIQYSVPSSGMMYLVSSFVCVVAQELVDAAGPGQAQDRLLGLERLLVRVRVEGEDVRREVQQQLRGPPRARSGSTEFSE